MSLCCCTTDIYANSLIYSLCRWSKNSKKTVHLKILLLNFLLWSRETWSNFPNFAYLFALCFTFNLSYIILFCKFSLFYFWINRRIVHNDAKNYLIIVCTLSVWTYASMHCIWWNLMPASRTASVGDLAGSFVGRDAEYTKYFTVVEINYPKLFVTSKCIWYALYREYVSKL